MRTDQQIFNYFSIYLGYNYLENGDICAFFDRNADIKIFIIKETKEVQKIKDWSGRNIKIPLTDREAQLIKELFEYWERVK